MAAIEVFAPAKVNLTLHVTGRRDDGYHLLDSLVVFASQAGDGLRADPARRLSLDVVGSAAEGVPGDGDNLVLRAADRLRARRGVTAGARITLDKSLPHGGGIGGGSADAAAAIRALSALWDVAPLSPDEALPLGADVPVCLAGPGPVRMRGIGEHLAPVPALPPFWLVLASPRRPVPTARVFSLLDATGDAGDPPPDDMPPASDFEEFAIWLGGQRNDLVAAALTIAPEIGVVLAALRDCPGAALARMSGSGSTCWGLFGDEVRAEAAARRLAERHPGWWIRATGVSS